jgi:hypothetical protein
LLKPALELSSGLNPLAPVITPLRLHGRRGFAFFSCRFGPKKVSLFQAKNGLSS